MAYTDAQIQFIRTMSSFVKKYNQSYQIDDACVVAIVAQACVESGYGKDSALTRGYNFFGMKTGSSWTGTVITVTTHEELPDGTIITITADFRGYASFEDGVVGYFDFIQTPRYDNLKLCTTPREYVETIKNDGWATSSGYVKTVMNVVDQIDYLVNDTPADSNPQPPQPPPPYGGVELEYTVLEQTAMDVISGGYGISMVAIENALQLAGFDVEEVFQCVGAILSFISKKKKRRR